VTRSTLRSRLQNLEVEEVRESRNSEVHIRDDEAFAERVRRSGDSPALANGRYPNAVRGIDPSGPSPDITDIGQPERY